MSTRLGIAIIGAGFIGRVHARVAVAHPGLHLVALQSRSSAAARDLAHYVESELQGEAPRVHAALGEVLADPEVDLVVVTTPSGTHVDIAEAAHVSVRAVQLAFRRHLGTTPMAYLRRVRLDHTHRALVAADARHTTVAAVAAQWGFTNHSRFTAVYRATYGVLPSTTLRGEPGP